MSDDKQKKKEEKRKKKIVQGVNTILFMIAVTIVFISVLSFIYFFTRDTVRANETLYIKRAVLFAADIKNDGAEKDVLAKFGKYVEEVKDKEGNLKYYKVKSPEEGGKTKGYVFIKNGAGLWGAISAVIALKPDMKTLTGIDFIKDNETPGLGARINQDWFKKQFRGKQGPFTLAPEDSKPGEQQFSAITGATITSTAVKKIVNEQLKEARKELKDDAGMEQRNTPISPVPPELK